MFNVSYLAGRENTTGFRGRSIEERSSQQWSVGMLGVKRNTCFRGLPFLVCWYYEPPLVVLVGDPLPLASD